MLNKIVQGRLGNQMFQYAAMRGIQEKFYADEKINFDFSQVLKTGSIADGFYNQLEGFKLNNEKCIYNNKIKLSIKQKFIFLIYFFSYKIIKIFSKESNYKKNKNKLELKFQNFFNINGLYLYNYGYFEFKKSKVKNKLFTGYYECSKYFNFIKEKILDEFTPLKPKISKNLYLYKIIEETNSVCVSIRRGDFLNYKNKKDCFVCDDEYFRNALKKMKELVVNPKFIIFSDDIKWVKENMNYFENCEYEDGTDPGWEKLRLMYSCKHYIISNSTFSWWGQYLSRNNNKIVIAPKKWRNGEDKNDIYEDGWILI